MLTKKHLIIGIKALVSISLIVFLLSNVGWEEIMANVATLNPGLVAFGFLIVLVQFPISSAKWQRALRQHDVHFGFWYLQTIGCIAYFLNNFLPSGIGGDAYRVFKTLPTEGRKSRGLSATLLDRIVGLCSLLFLGYVGAALLWRSQDIELLNFLVPVATLCIFLAVPLFYIGLKIGLVKKLDALPKIGSKLGPLTDNLRLIARPGVNLWVFILLCLTFQVSAVVLLQVLFQAASYPISLAHCAVIATVGGIAIMLPISIAGIGVYEGALVGAAVAIGVDAEPAIIASITLRLLTIPASVICGLVFLFSSAKPRTEIAQLENYSG